MKEYTIDCAGMETPRQLHQAIAREMNFPEWYGNNLDALYDMLTAISEDTRLEFRGFPAFAHGFRRVLSDAEKENPCLIITL